MTKYFYSFFFLEVSYCVDGTLQESNETYRCCTDKLARTISEREQKAPTLADPLVYGLQRKEGEEEEEKAKEPRGHSVRKQKNSSQRSPRKSDIKSQLP